MSNLRTIAIVAGAGLGVEVLRRAVVRSARIATITPAVSAAATTVLRRIPIDPCSGARAVARDYTELYVEQKRALKARFGEAPEMVCSRSGSGPCVPLFIKSIPTAPAGCTLDVIALWSRALADLAAEVGDDRGFLGWLGATLEIGGRSQSDDLIGLRDALDLQAALVRGAVASGGRAVAVPRDLNDRIWSNIAQASIALQGVLISHGDASREAASEFVATVISPASYAKAAADVGGGVAGAVGDVLGDAAGALLSSNLGAIAIVAGAGYLVWRSSQ